MTQKPLPIYDGHNDTILHYAIPQVAPHYSEAFSEFFGYRELVNRDFFQRSEQGHIDLPRAKEGGLAGGFWAISPIPEKGEDKQSVASVGAGEDGTFDVPLPPEIPHTYATRFTIAATSELLRMIAASAGQARLVTTADDIVACIDEEVFAIQLHFEGAEAIDEDLYALDVWYEVGLRSLGIVWSRSNIFGHGVPFRFPSSPDTGPGLTDAGERLVRRCNQLGILIDLSHLNEKGFWDVARISDAPLVATHSNAHAINAATRNLTDKQLAAIAETDGMVGVNFHVGFLREDGQTDPDTSLDIVIRHFDHLIEKLGEDRVGFGSDFDGAVMPRDLADCAHLPRLVEAMRAAGYGEPLLQKLAHQNWLRLLRSSWKAT
ncbi:MAG: dipeptidase [Chloroflexi bacterium]|nr:dipeptidase [Chloroflexota bacterium]